MSAFVGRTGSRRVYSYPEPRFAGLVGPFARNFASGPATDMGVTNTPALITWERIDSGGAPSSNVPITPKSTGIIRVTGVLEVASTSNVPVNVVIAVTIGGGPLVPAGAAITVAAEEGEAPTLALIPFQAETISALPVGAAHNVTVDIVTITGAVTLIAHFSSIDVQEVPAATG